MSIGIDRLGFLVEHFLSQKGPCRAGTTANITLSAEQTIDGVAVVTGDRVLVKDQTNGFNAIYVVSTSEWELADDSDQRGHIVKGSLVVVTDGTTNAMTQWVSTTSGRPVPGRETITFEAFTTGDGGDGGGSSATLDAIGALTPTDGNIIVGDGVTWVAESGNTARTSLGVGTGDSPQFTAIELGHATANTLTASGGNLSIEGNAVYRASGTDVPVADGGTGASSLTAFAVLCGGTVATSAIQALAALGGSGTVLTSNGAGALPSFQSPTGGSSVDQQVFTSSGTWTAPGSGNVALIQCWGAGGSGGRAGANDGGGGGGGGSYVERFVLLSSLGATETVTIGAGGASRTVDNTAGAAGGNTTFGAHVTAYGGGGGAGAAAQNGGGGGGGQTGAGASATTIAGAAGGTPRPLFFFQADVATVLTTIAVTWGNGAGDANSDGQPNVAGGGGAGAGGSGAVGSAGGQSIYGGGGGGGGSEVSGAAAFGGASIWGGGGGGGGSSTTAAASGGTSLYGGAGGAGAFDANNATAGTQPSGGGGGSETGNSGAGGDGKCIVTVW